MKRYTVTLTKDERNTLTEISSKGKHKSQKLINALILLGCDEGEFQEKRSTNEEISRVLKIGMRKIDRIKKRFVELGIDITLNGFKFTKLFNHPEQNNYGIDSNFNLLPSMEVG